MMPWPRALMWGVVGSLIASLVISSVPAAQAMPTTTDYQSLASLGIDGQTVIAQVWAFCVQQPDEASCRAGALEVLRLLVDQETR